MPSEDRSKAEEPTRQEEPHERDKAAPSEASDRDAPAPERDAPATEAERKTDPEDDREKAEDKTRSLEDRKEEIDKTFAEEREEIMKLINQKIRPEREL
jgi:hypothetical protein